ncbi:MAG: DDE-type integrase/transposase/recombinase [Flavobacteriales bacterium]|nr:DDE-type integrase/transposase/recombinase [Flavobacteriales bacterium]
MSRTYTSYHTSVKLTHALGIEKQIFTKDFLETIPSSTSQYWKSMPSKQYAGSEFEEITKCSLQELRILADMRIKNLRRLFVGFAKLYLSFLSIFGKTNLLDMIKSHRKKLVPRIDRLVEVFQNKKLVLKFLGITANQYAHWKLQEGYACAKSMIWLCYKRVPRQVSMKEISMIKILMAEKETLHWSSASVWGYAVRQGKISMARTTWYYYCKLFQLNEARKKYRPVRKRVSVRAEAPNQIWHMDVSVYKTADNVKYYIYSVVDNFSRKILAYDYSGEMNAAMRLLSLRRAVEREFGVNIQAESPEQIPKLDLVVDGGTENNNKTIEDFISESQVDITKLVALKDVLYSNSIVEGSFRMLKSYYLKEGIESEGFPVELALAIEDVNFKRPHYAHLIYTPDEVHKNPELKNLKPQLQKVNYARIAENRAFPCGKNCK